MKKTFQELCDLLPADVNWGDPISPALVQEIVDRVGRDNLKDHVIRETVNQLRDVAVQFHAHQSLRDRIAHVVVPFLRSKDS